MARAARLVLLALVWALFPPVPALAAGTADLEAGLEALSTPGFTPLGSIGAGYTFYYRITVTNNGPDASSGSTATLTLAAGTGFVAGSPGCSAGGVTVTCAMGSLAPAQSASSFVEVTAPASGPASASMAVGGAGETDPDGSNDSATTTIQIIPVHDYRVTKVASPSPVGPGGVITYTITLTNDGPSDGTKPVVVDTIPSGTTFVSIDSPDADKEFCAAAGPGFGPSDYGCRWTAIAAGATRTITLLVQAPAFPTTITNTVTAYSNPTVAEVDDDPANDTFTLDTDVVSGGPAPTPVPTPTPTPTPTGVDLSITKTASTYGSTRIGDLVTYQIGVHGGIAASTYTITDTIPSGLDLTSWPTSRCSFVAPVLTCTGSGLGLVFSIDAEIVASGSITNSASVAGDQADPDLANNTASVTFNVEAESDLSLTMSGPGFALAGQPMTYTLTVTNGGPDPVPSGVIEDTLPAGSTFSSASAGCTSSGMVVCTFGPLAANASTSFTVTVLAPAAATATNSAIVVGANHDPDPSNDTASVTNTVTALSDISVTKTASTTAVAPGGSVTYTVTATNAGPSETGTLGVEDALPAMLTVTSVSCPGGAPAITGHPACLWTAVPAGENRTMTVTAMLGATSATSFTNAVQAGGPNVDPDTTNNTASATVTVVNTATGASVSVSPTDPSTGATPVTVTFGSVTSSGTTTVTSGSSGPPPPSGFIFNGVYFEVSTTAAYTPPITICFEYTGSPAPQIYHYESGAWVAVPTMSTGTQVCGQVSSLSPFVLLVPLAVTLEGLMQDVVSLGLPKGLTASLVVKLRAAMTSSPPASCGQLDAFVHHVRALSGRTIDGAEANALISGALTARSGACP